MNRYQKDNIILGCLFALLVGMLFGGWLLFIGWGLVTLIHLFGGPDLAWYQGVLIWLVLGAIAGLLGGKR